MRKLKRVVCTFNFYIEQHPMGKVFIIDDYELALYPLTYTLMECLEHLCGIPNWELVRYQPGEESRIGTSGEVTISRLIGFTTFANTFHGMRVRYREERMTTEW